MSTVNIQNMKMFLIEHYPGWDKKVDNMETRQIVAIYHRLKNKDAEVERKRQQEKEKPKFLTLTPKKPKDEYHQMTLWELFSEISKDDGDEG